MSESERTAGLAGRFAEYASTSPEKFRDMAELAERVAASLRGENAAEAEAREILDRVERDLPTLEARIDRLMHRYGL